MPNPSPLASFPALPPPEQKPDIYSLKVSPTNYQFNDRKKRVTLQGNHLADSSLTKCPKYDSVGSQGGNWEGRVGLELDGFCTERMGSFGVDGGLWMAGGVREGDSSRVLISKSLRSGDSWCQEGQTRAIGWLDCAAVLKGAPVEDEGS